VLFRALIAGTLSLALISPAFAADPRQGEQWGLEMVNAPGAWATSTGVGAVVAVIDTGVQPDHPDLQGRLAPGFDFAGSDPDNEGDEDDDPRDGEGHGTHVTGIVVAGRDNDRGIVGIAPDALVMPIRALDDDGGGWVSDVTASVDFAVEHGAHVINLSLGGEVPLQDDLFGDPEFRSALERAADNGRLVIVAAGNNGLPDCENPELPGSLCVGSVDARGNRSVFSNFGGGVHLMAPGGSLLGGSSEDVLSTYPQSTYETLAGTSQAVPHVAGVAALLASLGVRGEQAANRIVSTAADAGAPGPDGEYGAGIVDAQAAVAGLAPPPPPPPGDPDPVTGSFSSTSPVKRRAVRRRGFRVKCRAVRPGPCAVTVRRKGRRIARGRADVPAQLPTVVTAALNRRGKRVLKRMGERLRTRVAVTLPGEPTRTSRVIIER
jgi:subtilisin family serine protease